MLKCYEYNDNYHKGNPPDSNEINANFKPGANRFREG